MKGRRKPYTEIGIARLKCIKCGRQATQQWQVCADNRLYRPMCDKCDIELNEMVLRWAGFKDWKEKMANYKLRF
jgi:NAD-dependent SIR2 family protein deacetylase